MQLPADFKNPDRYAVLISESRLGLPDRDYYLKDDPQLKALREKYVAYVAQMLTLGTAAPMPHAKARDDHGVRDRGREGAVADREAPRRGAPSTTRAPRSSCSPTRRASRGRASSRRSSSARARTWCSPSSPPSATWRRSSAARRVPTLKAFLTFHYLSDSAAYLPKRFDEARFAFYGQALRGQPQQRERWKRGVDAVDEALGEAVGQLYVAQYFPPESKAKMQELVADLRAALSERIDALDWMSPQTKTRAHEKLATFTPKIGYPDTWKDYSALVVRAR